jgi:hypothetical protein
MLSSVECSAEADKLESLARKSVSESARQTLLETAAEWRRPGVLADVQETWEAMNPLTDDTPPKPAVED